MKKTTPTAPALQNLNRRQQHFEEHGKLYPAKRVAAELERIRLIKNSNPSFLRRRLMEARILKETSNFKIVPKTPGFSDKVKTFFQRFTHRFSPQRAQRGN